MTNEPSIAELNGFLATHEDPGAQQLFAEGDNVGEWKVTGLLGRGGNAEVYRVVRPVDAIVPIASEKGGASIFDANETLESAKEAIVDETVGALKVLLRDDAATRMRFEQEIKLLRENTSPTLARFIDAGEADGRPYLVTELLEPVDLPEIEKEIADYLIAVCRAVAALHRLGLVHRDIKPSNIMRRANGELVLIDLGLVKDVAKSSEPEKDVSIVSSRVVAVGTPRFAAPEQMTGGAITSVADIHALGRLADMTFHSKPPRCWLPIIRRATSSIPGQRYASVEDLSKAIRQRHRQRQMFIAVSALLAVALVGAVVGRGRSPVSAEAEPSLRSESLEQCGPQPDHNARAVKESAAWQSLCQNTTTNLIVRELVWERPVTNKIGKTILVSPERAYRKVTKPTEVTFVRLRGKTIEFERPISLNPAREYFIEGPGVLAADLQANSGPVCLHLKNCILLNRSTVSIDKANIRYVFEGGSYLNFTRQDSPSPSVIAAQVDGLDGSSNEIRFKGPETKEGLIRLREKESRERLNRSEQKISENIHFPCRILPSIWKYTVEDMEDSIYKKYGIDPNRTPTDAEVELVAYCFDVSLQEAESILTYRNRRLLNFQESNLCTRSILIRKENAHG